MGLDTGSIFKWPVLCGSCHEDYLFTLRAIAESSQLKCLSCSNIIAIDSADYEPPLSEVRNRLLEIDSASLVPAFDRCNPCRRGTVDPDRDQLRSGAIKNVAHVRKDRDHAQKGNSRLTYKP